MRLYDFQFRILPWAVKQFQGEAYSEILAYKDDFISLNIKHFEATDSPFEVEGLDWENMEVVPIQCNENYLLVIYIFPKQTDVPLCDYVAFWHNRVEKSIHYYTFEVSMDSTWVLGSQEGDKHINMGRFKDGSVRAFCSALIDREIDDKETKKIVWNNLLGTQKHPSDDSYFDLVQQLVDGRLTIDDIWKNKGEELDNVEIHTVAQGDVKPLSILYCKYAQNMMGNGYLAKAKPYYDKAIDTLLINKDKMDEQDYLSALTELLSQRSGLSFKQGNYFAALKDVKIIRKMCPDKDEYIEIEDNIRQGMINKFATPIYVIIAVTWLLMLMESKFTHTKIIPSCMWDIGWTIWVILLIVQFVVPWLIKKVRR